MNDKSKTKSQLIEELEELRRRVSELEHQETKSVQVEDTVNKRENHLRFLIDILPSSMFCFEFDNPIPTDLPNDEQVKLMYECTLVDCNDACALSYGYEKPDEVIGKRFNELFPAVPESVDKLFNATIENNYRIEEGEGRSIQPDGSIRYFLNSAYGVIENGKLLRMWGSFRDITNRKQMEELLRHSEQRYRLLVENTPSVIRMNLNGAWQMRILRVIPSSGTHLG